MTEQRGPEAMKLAEEMIENAKAVSAAEALEAGLVDFIATDLDDLLEQLDGFTVRCESGEQTLDTAGAQTSDVPMSFIEQMLQILINPNIVFLLLTIGVQAILIELSSPGGWVAGFIGVVCLALAAYGLGVLPVNWFGIIFLIAAFVLFIVDIKAPTHGALTAAGVASLHRRRAGAVQLAGITPHFQQVSVPLVILVALVDRPCVRRHRRLRHPGPARRQRAPGRNRSPGRSGSPGRHIDLQWAGTGAGGERTVERGTGRGLRTRSAQGITVRWFPLKGCD